mgnify:CR=1 FL=1
MELYLNSYGSYVYKKGKMFEIKTEKIKKKISPKRISSVIIANAATISTDAIQMAIDYNIDIVFLDKFGNPYGRIWHSKLGSTTYIRRKLLEIYLKDEGTKFVKRWVENKMDNQIGFIKKLLSKRPKIKNMYDSKINKMNDLKVKLTKLEGKLSKNSQSIRGYEGNLSKHYFKIISELIPQKYKFSGRSTKPAKDPFNASINYGYGILYGKVEKALIIAGLDPYIGLLHSDNYNKKSLVFDFIEPFRILIEEPVFYLFSRHKFNENHFDKIKNGVSLNENGKKILVPQLMEFFETKIKYKNRTMKKIYTIQKDAHDFANFLIGKNNF